MMYINKNQIDVLKQRMESELLKLENEIHTELDPELKLNYVDAGGDGDSGDEAFANSIVDSQNAVLNLHTNQVSDLKAALDRIEKKVYGICIDCGEGISHERITVYPTAKRCFKCQHMREMRLGKLSDL